MTKKVLWIVLAVALVALAVSLADQKWLARGGGSATGPLPDAPSVTMKDLEGNDVTLEQFRGKVVLVNFWATWCAPCQIEMPWFIEFQEKYGAQGFTVLGVAMDEEGRSVVGPFIQGEEFDVDGRKMKVNYPILLGNDDLAQKFGGLLGLPTTLVISRDGKITKRFIGLVNHELIQKEIERQLSPITTAN
jgi:cytochrome c biogenesis protein CcmG/thiol:disulfide interchange protein DsbE